MEFLSTMMGGSKSPKYRAPGPNDEVGLTHSVERSPTGPSCEIVYDVAVGTQPRVRRRYVHFRALHAATKREAGSSFSAQLPECAPVRTMQDVAKGRSGEATERIIRQRTTRLQVYLRSVVVAAGGSEAVRDFLSVNVGAWDDPPEFADAEDAVDVDDEGIEDPEVAASVREQRGALARARQELDRFVSERQALDAATEDGHDPAAVVVTTLASELAAARDATSCAVKHKDRLEQLRALEVDTARRQARRDKAKLVAAVAAIRRDEVEGVERPRVARLAVVANERGRAADAAAEARDVETFRGGEWAPSRAKASEASEAYDHAEGVARHLETRLADLERREAEVVAEAAARREEADVAATRAADAKAALELAREAGDDALREATDEATRLAKTCDDRATIARSRLGELRRAKRLWKAHDASRREMVAAAATREAASLRDGPLRLLSHRIDALEAEFRDDHATSTLTASVMAADAIFSAREDALRRASKRVSDAVLVRDRAQAEARAAELAASVSAATAAECVSSTAWTRATAREARERADAFERVRDRLVRDASEKETDWRTRHADREEQVATLRRQSYEALVDATEADFAVATREALLVAGPAFSLLAKETSRGVYPEDDDEPLFPGDLVDRLRLFPTAEDDDTDGGLDDGDDSTPANGADFKVDDIDDALADAQDLVSRCEAERDRLATEHAEATVRVNDERAQLDAHIKQAKERVIAAERAIVRLTAYSATHTKDARTTPATSEDPAEA
ncbi:hypothetical protein CTAYLR_001202 [Chrysophaeum taylorii]|uniref:PX domain-containing protein n=1 Tax=Chrysophaeum taylorii TaxID=2483200 RepID=A0AAD7UE12_9STRA|nr:hypothetical protein CTAYLR_001202 [Chrysophaeum taylorii]